MEHAIDNAEMGFVVFSKLTSHATIGHSTFAYQLQKKVTECNRDTSHIAVLSFLSICRPLSHPLLSISQLAASILLRFRRSHNQHMNARSSWLFGLTPQAARPTETSGRYLQILSCFVAACPLHLPTHTTYQTRAQLSLANFICLGADPSQHLGRN